MLSHDLTPLLDASRAADAFKAAVREYATTGRSERVVSDFRSPPIKVLRTIAQLLAAEPRLAVERVEVEGRSGCSDFVGSITVWHGEPEPRVYDFVWDCAWRAQSEGWTDSFGFPDQIRAAREFGWDCFEQWGERVAEEA